MFAPQELHSTTKECASSVTCSGVSPAELVMKTFVRNVKTGSLKAKTGNATAKNKGRS